MKRATNRKGFTLVELLIVIVVIGILSAMMMLSSTEAVTSANASNIVSNMRNLKTAALAWYVDNMDYLEETTATDKSPTQLELGDNTTDKRKGIYRYLNDNNITITNNTFTASGFTYGTEVKRRENSGTNPSLADSKWYITCTVPDQKVREKLVGRAKSVGILKQPAAGATETIYATGDVAGTTKVYYLVR